jgi:hypothetical protein
MSVSGDVAPTTTQYGTTYLLIKFDSPNKMYYIFSKYKKNEMQVFHYLDKNHMLKAEAQNFLV